MITTGTPGHVSPLMAMLYPRATQRCDQCGGFVAMSPEEALRQWSEATYQPLLALSKALQDPMLASMTGLPAAISTTEPGRAYGGQSWAPGKLGSGHTRDHKHRHGRHHHGGHHQDCGCEQRHDRGCDQRHDRGCDQRHDRGCDQPHDRGCEQQHECGTCGRDNCHCRCCVVDADLVIYVRAGERRIVPLLIDNDRRRERHIRLELSDFTSKGGSHTSVTSRLLSPEEFTLAPCQEREVVLEIAVASVAASESKAAAGDTKESDERLLDIDDCAVAYADLRIVGCDNRPIRIAVAALPRDCDAYHVGCACGCC